MKHKELLEDFEWREPGPEALAYLNAIPNSDRGAPMSGLVKTPSGMCAWCNTRPAKKHASAKYCNGSHCSDSAMIYCYPQSRHAKAWIFMVRQECTCLSCGEIFEDEIDSRIKRRHELILDYHKQYGWKVEKVTYYSIGSGIGHLWHLDHIVPLFKGGRGIGLENVQMVCVGCHQKKTAGENSTRLKDLFAAGK